MKTSLLLAFVLLGACANAAGHSTGPGGPLFLAPSGPPDPRINKKLCVTNADYGRAIFLSSYTGEWSVSVHGADYTSSQPGSFRITLLEAKRGIVQPVIQAGHWGGFPWWLVSVKRSDVVIDRELAEAIRSAWTAMLKKTRTPKPSEHPTTDEPAPVGDYAVQFSVTTPQGKILQGTDYDSPEHTLPDEMVNIGFALQDYAKGSPGNRPAMREKLLRRLRRFERRVNQT